jgi:hypothetical protein
MSTQRTALLFAISYVACLTAPPIAWASECNSLYVQIGGTLRSRTPIGETAAAERPGDVIDVPLDAISADDVEFGLKLVRVGERHWSVDVRSNHTKAPIGDHAFISDRLQLYFTEEGHIDTPRSVITLAPSQNERASDSAVVVTFANIALADETSLRIAESSVVSERCFMHGQLDVFNEVNWGEETKIRYFSGEEGIRVMLSESAQ